MRAPTPLTDKMLTDLGDAMLHLCKAFQKHNLPPPTAIVVPYKAKAPMLQNREFAQHSVIIGDQVGKGVQTELCGVKIWFGRRDG